MSEFLPGPYTVSPNATGLDVKNTKGHRVAAILGMPSEETKANAVLLARSPSMLALLEKALPIIQAEAERRTFSYSPKQDTDPYWSEMRDLANEIEAEIRRARGQPIPEDDTDDYDYAADDRNFDAARERGVSNG